MGGERRGYNIQQRLRALTLRLYGVVYFLMFTNIFYVALCQYRPLLCSPLLSSFLSSPLLALLAVLLLLIRKKIPVLLESMS